MHERFGRLSKLDPQASQSPRVIACFDDLIVGDVNTRALVSAAASLAGCNAGYCQDSGTKAMCVTPDGVAVPGDATPAAPPSRRSVDGITAWLDRQGPPQANDAIILERLTFALRLRHCRGRHDDQRHDLGLLVDPEVPLDDRRTAASRLHLAHGTRYRSLAAPLFAIWDSHPTGAEDVIATPVGSIHAIVVPEKHHGIDASPCGIGLAATIDNLHRSFSTAVVALRLCAPPDIPVVNADTYGALIGLLADLPEDTNLPDLDALDAVMKHPWGATTVDVLVQAGTVRHAARLAGVHHSTLQTRLDTITDTVGFDPLDGLGRSRLGITYLFWRLRHSRVLDLAAPTTNATPLHRPPLTNQLNNISTLKTSTKKHIHKASEYQKRHR